MSDHGSAGERLTRILVLLPLASRDGGVSLAEAAATLGVPIDTIRSDIEEISARAWYHPSGSADEIQISLEVDRLKVFSSRKFDRPPRLSGREAAALSLGLRAAAADVPPNEREGLRSLARRLDGELAVRTSLESLHRFSIEDGGEAEGGLRSLLGAAVAGGRCVEISYLKPDDVAPTDRRVDPYRVVYGLGGWFLIGYCHLREQVLVFRLDRIVAASLTDESFVRPVDFDPAEYTEGGRVFLSGETEQAYVRYSAVIAPWIREKGPCDELPDGSVAVSYSTADPGWAVRHVLQYGAEAELLEPAAARDLVVASARRLLEGGSEAAAVN
jgi:predicted DNA-binding transcriptional regulator YafY